MIAQNIKILLHTTRQRKHTRGLNYFTTPVSRPPARPLHALHTPYLSLLQEGTNNKECFNNNNLCTCARAHTCIYFLRTSKSYAKEVHIHMFPVLVAAFGHLLLE